MKTYSRLLLAIMVALVTARPLTAQTTKIGTFDKASVTVAFYRSPLWSTTMRGKMAEMQRAKQAHDQNKVAELEQWGSSSQELAHKQLAGEAPITNILEAMQTMFPGVAARAHVTIIAPDLAYSDSTVEIVDVTSLLLDELKADQKTRQVIEELRALKKPAVLHD